MDHETKIASVKIAAATGGTIIASLTWSDLAAIVTIVFGVLQIGLLLPKYKAWLFGRSTGE